MLIYSVIVPVYNVERYLAECVESILTQDSESAYEIILVDDGSTDHSGEICDQYAEKVPHVRAIHQENHGQSNARNNGLRQAQGMYILFCDSDDLWAPEMLSSLDAVIRENPDIVSFGYQTFDSDGNAQECRILPTCRPVSGREYLDELFHQGTLPVASPCMYLFRRAFLMENELYFDESLTYGEDLEHCLRAIPGAERIVGIDRALYRYRKMREGSHTNSLSMRKIRMDLTAIAMSWRRLHAPAIANYYCQRILLIADLTDRTQIQEMTRFLNENQDILRHTSGRKEMFYRALFRLFGFYHGAVIYRRLNRIMHTLWNR